MYETILSCVEFVNNVHLKLSKCYETFRSSLHTSKMIVFKFIDMLGKILILLPLFLNNDGSRCLNYP
jgi:hypothetical protein